MSDYQNVKDRLEDLCCQTCNGSGLIDDAEPGDICYNSYTCNDCCGTGWNDGSEKKRLVTI